MTEASPQDSTYEFWKPDPNAKLIALTKNGKTAYIDFFEGELVYSGDLPISESAKVFFDYLAHNIPNMMIAKFGREAIERAKQ